MDIFWNHTLESQKTLTQLKEKSKSLVEKYKKIKGNNKATGRAWLLLRVQGQDYPRYMGETDIFTDSPDRDSSTGESTSTSTCANSDGEEADDDKATKAKTWEDPPKKAVKHKAEKKREETGPNRRKMEKRKKTDERESMVELLQGQQEMMMKGEGWDRLAMQELMKFEMEAEKRHQDFTLAALKELGNIFNKKDWFNRTQATLGLYVAVLPLSCFLIDELQKNYRQQW